MNKDQVVIELDKLSGEAAIWFQRLSDQDVSPETQAAFDEWIRADDAHMLAYEEYSTLWHHRDFDQILQEFADEEKKPALNITKWIAVAASLLLCLSALYYGVGLNGFTGKSMIYQTAIGEWKNITLSDGSLLVLNTDSKVQVTFTDQRKISLLQGEAYFDVKKDGREFIVEGGTGRIKVLGTAFNARVQHNKMVVMVDRGKVSVSAISQGNKQEKLLLKNDQLTVTDERVGTVLRVREKVADWREGWLDVNDRSLAEVVKEFDRYYPGEIRLHNRDMWQLRVTGRFNLKNIKKAVQLLGESMELKVKVSTNNEIVISYKSKS